MNKFFLIPAIFAFGLLTLGNSGCDGNKTETSTRDIEAKKSADASNAIKFSANAERDNIVKRVTLTSDPGLVGYVVLFNDAGAPIAYYGVRGKITSGNKRLTPRDRFVRCDKGQAHGDCLVESPSDEGTYGSSNPYVYFWTSDNQYIQWSGAYIYSDKPIRLRVEPLVISVKPAEK